MSGDILVACGHKIIFKGWELCLYSFLMCLCLRQDLESSCKRKVTGEEEESSSPINVCLVQ